jgi:NAD(P)-dependent dehydrogenase (short-subunit alcohol dehydrogenase family)
MPEARSINGRVAAVTGGARGIGAAIAQALAAEGARVAIGDLDGDEAEALATRIGSDAIGFSLDVCDSDSFAAFLDEAESRLGGLDVLVNNAGVMWVGPFADEPEATALRQLDVNLHGVIRGMKLAVPRLRGRGGGHVVNVASAASKVTPAGEATYTASKHAVYGYSAAVREELRGSGIEVSVVMPAVVRTELAAGTSSGRGREPLTPDDVAAAVVKALRRPRFEVYVPSNIAPLARLLAMLPQRARDALHRAVVPDQVLETDRSARADYERRRVES